MKKEYYIFKIDLKFLNIFASILFVFVLILTFLIFPNQINAVFEMRNSLSMCILVIPTMIGYFILHELLHSFSYVIHGGKWEKITFGAELEKGVFYCLCKQDITRKNILNSSMFPLFYIGILTFVVSIIFNLPLLLLLSICNISGAAGDIMYFLFIRKLDKDVMFSELDDGTSFAILADYDVSKIKHIGLEYVSKQESISRVDFQKIKISRLSYFVFLICILLVIVALFI